MRMEASINLNQQLCSHDHRLFTATDQASSCISAEVPPILRQVFATGDWIVRVGEVKMDSVCFLSAKIKCPQVVQNFFKW